MFQYFRDTEKNIINDSTMDLLGPLKLSEKYQIPEKFIYKILKHAGLKEIKPLEEPPEPMPLAKTPKKQTATGKKQAITPKKSTVYQKKFFFVSKSQHPRRSKEIPLEEYIDVQLRYHKFQESVKKQNFIDSGRKPKEYCEDFRKRTEQMTVKEYNLVIQLFNMLQVFYNKTKFTWFTVHGGRQPHSCNSFGNRF